MPGKTCQVPPYTETGSGICRVEQWIYCPVPNCCIQKQSCLTWTMICYSLYSLFPPFLFPGSSPFTTLNPSQILLITFFSIGPSFATSVPKFDNSDTAKWVTLAVHSITDTVTLVLLALGDCSP